MFEGVLKLVNHSYIQHLETFQPEQMRDFMDVFIKQMKEVELKV